MATNTLLKVENKAAYEGLVIYRCHTARFKAVQLHSSSESHDDSMMISCLHPTFVFVPQPLQVAKTLEIAKFFARTVSLMTSTVALLVVVSATLQNAVMERGIQTQPNAPHLGNGVFMPTCFHSLQKLLSGFLRHK